MLKTLYINNYAIIDELGIDFSSKLNVITGETGAGKSILMGALSLILGDRADSSALLNREKKCVVEGTFIANHYHQLAKLLKEHDLDTGDQEVIIRREIAATGKSRAFINDSPVNLELLRQVSSHLVDLHRQFDTLSLSDAHFQREVLDALANNHSLLQQYQLVFRNWRKLEQELSALIEQKTAFNREYDYNKFLYDELDQAAFQQNELEDADAELRMLSNSESIKSALTAACEVMSSGEQPLAQQLKSVHHHLAAFEKYTAQLGDILKRIHSLQIELQDVAEEVERLSDEINHDPRRIEQLNDRIALGYKLMKKHGVQSTSELLRLYEAFGEKLQAVLNIDVLIEKKETEARGQQQELNKLSEKLNKQRKAQIKPFEDKVNNLLAQVGMPNARLKVAMESKAPDNYGADNIEFLFDANTSTTDAVKSGRFEPIGKVASGGELSRLMLSIKSLVAESIDLPTMIFDEIDTGISGEAARQVGLIMQKMATSRQIITITHQPQIAGKADAHLFVFKESRNNTVRTNIRLLSGDERITAIAKMLSGEKPTAAAMENAREMVMN